MKKIVFTALVMSVFSSNLWAICEQEVDTYQKCAEACAGGGTCYYNDKSQYYSYGVMREKAYSGDSACRVLVGIRAELEACMIKNGGR